MTSVYDQAARRADKIVRDWILETIAGEGGEMTFGELCKRYDDENPGKETRDDARPTTDDRIR